MIGYPEWWDPSKALKRKVMTSTVTPSVSIAIAEKSPPNATALHISSDSQGKVFFNPASIGSSAWIIDSGSTDHMSFDIAYVSQLKPFKQSVVSTTNGTQTSVIGKGSFR